MGDPMGLDDLRRRSRELLLEVLRSVAERRRVAVAAAGEKLRLGMPLEDPEVEASLWDASIAEASRNDMDERSAGRIAWTLIRDSLMVQGALREEPAYPPGALEEDVVRLDLDLWEPLVELDAEGAARKGGRASTLEESESELAAALGVDPGSLVSFPSWRDSVWAVLRATAEGVGVIMYEPVHPWLASAVWSAGGRPYRVHRDVDDCWRLRPPDVSRRGWILMFEDPDYVTGVAHGQEEFSELSEFSGSAHMPLVHLGLCGPLSLRGPAWSPGPVAVSIGGIGCAMGSLDVGISWVIAPGISGRIRRLRDAAGALPRPRDVSSTSRALSSGAIDRARAAVSERLEYVRSMLSGRIRYCEPSSGPHLFAVGPRQPAWKSGVAVARGVAFGAYPDGFRVNFMVDEESLSLGLGRLILSMLPG
ncbi:MAG: hypothetical protein ACP5KM_03150 [Conexivisphaera sp.]